MFGLDEAIRRACDCHALVNDLGLCETCDGKMEGLPRHALLGKRIEAFWLDPENRGADTWTEHLDINRVVLATSLAPEGFLGFG